MAKVKGKEEKATKKLTQKEELFDNIGGFMAEKYDTDINRLKGSCVPSECLVFTAENGKDYTITITEKKNNIEFEEDNVVKVYEAPAPAPVTEGK